MDEKKNVFQRIHAVMNDVKGVAKKEENKHGNYKYAGHEAVTEALRDSYLKHGLHRAASVVRTERRNGDLLLEVDVTWTNIDQPDDSFSVRAIGESGALTKSGGASPQQAGIALSYAVKNAEFKVFALTGDDTPDGDEAKPQGESVLEILLDRYEVAETKDEVMKIREDVKKSWKIVSRFSAQLKEAHDGALRRVAN